MAQDQGQAARSQGTSASQRQRKNWLLRTQPLDCPRCKCLETRRQKGLGVLRALSRDLTKKSCVTAAREQCAISVPILVCSHPQILCSKEGGRHGAKGLQSADPNGEAGIQSAVECSD